MRPKRCQPFAHPRPAQVRERPELWAEPIRLWHSTYGLQLGPRGCARLASRRGGGYARPGVELSRWDSRRNSYSALYPLAARRSNGREPKTTGRPLPRHGTQLAAYFRGQPAVAGTAAESGPGDAILALDFQHDLHIKAPVQPAAAK